MSSRAFLVVCDDCPPFDPATAEAGRIQAAKPAARRAHVTNQTANPAFSTVDLLWCRRGATATVDDVRVRARRTHG